MIPNKKIHLLDELQELLERQMEMAHHGNLTGKQFEQLNSKTVPIVEKITQAKILEMTEFGNQRDYLKKLYEDLCLAIAAQKADITEKLSQVRKGRKTIAVYRRGI